MTPASLLLVRVRYAAKRLLMLGMLTAVGSCWVGLSTAGALPSSFGVEGTGAGQISGARGVAVEAESGDVYVVDQGNDRIDKFGPEGQFLLAWGWGVADGESEELQSCTTKCFAGLHGPGGGELSFAEGIAVDNDPLSASHGDVYVVDAGNSRVQKFGPEGEFILMFGVEGAGSGEFQELRGRSVAVDAAGTVYVGDKERVQRFSEAGTLEGETVFPGIGRIENLALDSVKDLYLKGSEASGVHKYDATGKELGAPRDEAGAGEALALAIGPADELFLNDLQTEHQILRLDASGTQTAAFDPGEPAEDGGSGIAYGENTKALYVLNQGRVRIVTLPSPGPFIVSGSESASEVQPASATLGAIANPEGSSVTKCRFEYGTGAAYGQSTPEEELKGGESQFAYQPLSGPITGLSPVTEYHFRLVCENAAKEAAFGPDQTFTTLPPVSIDGTSASQVNATSARLQAELNPHGRASEYRFEYGTSSVYGKSVPIPDASAGAGTIDTTVADLIQELSPSTTYHYRVVAHNALNKPGEVVEGPDQTFRTQGAASILADGRAWEQVSPPNKHGAPLEPLTEEGGPIQSAAGGGAFAYVAIAPINGEPAGVRSPTNSQLLATRGPEGWSTQDISTPHEKVTKAHPGVPSEYTFFAEDLRTSAVEPEGATPLSPQTTEGTPYRREADGEYVPLVTAANVPVGTKFGNEVQFLTATPDLSHIMLSSRQILAAGFKAGFESAGRSNLYEFANGKLTLVSVLPGPGAEPAAEAELSAGMGRNNKNMRGAVSKNGNRVVFEVNGEEHLYVRDVRLAQTLLLDQRQPEAAGGSGKASFQGANSDGTRVFFTDASRLTSDATAKPNQPDLYMCEVEVIAGQLSCKLSDLSVDPNANAGEAANVQGVVSAIDAAGEHVYFAASGRLTSTPNSEGELAVTGDCENEAGSCNLYMYDTVTQQIELVAVLSSRDTPDWGRDGDNLGGLTASSSPNGSYFAFMSERSLAGYDNRDVRSGEADAEVYLFDATTGALTCPSCNPTGARPEGVLDPPREVYPGLLVDHARSWRERWLAGSIPGWTLESLGLALYQSRYLSDSGRMFFTAADSLVPQDTNKVEDVYEYEPLGVGGCSSSSETYYSTPSGGCVTLISSGTSKEESAFLDASQSGNEVFFLTDSRLTPSDIDGALDIYDAHVCSASSPCPPPPFPPPPVCEGDACQAPSSPPNDATPGSLTYKGPGNAVVLSMPVKPVGGRSRVFSRAQKLAVAVKACKRKPRRKRLVCERQARRRYRVVVVRPGKSVAHNTDRRVG